MVPLLASWSKIFLWVVLISRSVSVVFVPEPVLKKLELMLAGSNFSERPKSLIEEHTP